MYNEGIIPKELVAASTVLLVLSVLTEAGCKELDEQWKALRRGWFVGGESFAEKLKEGPQKAVKGRRRESHSGPVKVSHDEAAAEHSRERALKALNLDKAALHAQAQALAQ